MKRRRKMIDKINTNIKKFEKVKTELLKWLNDEDKAVKGVVNLHYIRGRVYQI